MNNVKRVLTAPSDPRNANIQVQYAADSAAWIWHSDPALYARDNGSMVEFSLDFELDQPLSEIFQITADNRFELFLDGEYLAMGPDRSDVDHWSFSSLKIDIPAGKHAFTARCWYYPDAMPNAQHMDRPGFLFAASTEALRPVFNTGLGKWNVRQLNGITFNRGGWATGCCSSWNVAEFFAPSERKEPVVILKSREGTHWGGRWPYWRLFPSNLPEQTRNPYPAQKIAVRAVMHAFEGDEFPVTAEDTARADEIKAWQGALLKNEFVTVPANTTHGIVLDFGTYLTAYPELTVKDGQGAVIRVMWNEAFHAKGEFMNRVDRSEIAGKYFDSFQWNEYADFDGPERKVSSFWWKAGRYAVVKIVTKDAPVSLRMRFLESRYPLEAESQVTFDDPVLNDIQPMMVRALQMCMHETFMDCPYYEQLQYVGDTRTEALTALSMQRESGLPLRALHLFDWSRSEWSGLVAEHYPGRGNQLSATYSAIWPLMVRDYMMYRPFTSDSEFFRLRRSVRSMLNALGDYVNADGLIEGLPGWSFVDWAKEWYIGIPFPLDNMAASSVFTLHYLMSLRAAIELEQDQPEFDGDLVAYWTRCFDRSAAALKKHFWVPEKSLFADELTLEHFSQHAQCLALLSGAITGPEARACYDAMQTYEPIIKPTLYFIHYLLDTYALFGEGGKILDHASIWSGMLKLGAVTTWETPEPTRSDCHAWGAHLFHHYFASIAGIRPASPAFRTVTVNPSMGTARTMNGSYVHPDGMIDFDLTNNNGKVTGSVTLPDGITGTFVNCGSEKPLHAGKNIL